MQLFKPTMPLTTTSHFSLLQVIVFTSRLITFCGAMHLVHQITTIISSW